MIEKLIKIRIRDVENGMVIYLAPSLSINEGNGIHFCMVDGKVQFMDKWFIQVSFGIPEDLNTTHIKKKLKSLYPAPLRKHIKIEDVKDYIKKQDTQR